MHIDIIYATTEGQTKKIAEHLADMLSAQDHVVVLQHCESVPERGSVRLAHAFIVMGSVHFGKLQPALAQFVNSHRQQLTSSPALLIAVCGAAVGEDEQSKKEVQKYVDQFLATTNWKPTRWLGAAGAIAYTKYNPLMRWMMKRICKKVGGPTDTSRDHELTDWLHLDANVQRFVDQIAAIPKPTESEPASG